MTHDWILDVLTDLRTFAEKNDMTALAEQLDDTKIVAAVEIASKSQGAGFGLFEHDDIAGGHPLPSGDVPVA
ncbi:hypothetical protein [Mesobacterium pallidum]|uniref:hypothetical protein n=1 Tax=Mesobacterium pallidum TaxID=2872037 RepID=UPI001EE30D83|nr:hypothetical protein [Mesobacterium pallidum]